MKWRYSEEEADVLIVGAGAAGGVLAKELSDAGLRVVVLDAGPMRDPQRDFASDELYGKELGWQDTRIVDGAHPLTMGHNNSGYGVGGGTVHFTGVILRFHESDFKTKSYDGVGENWPIHYKDLEPYYNKIEKDIRVSGPAKFPWGNFNGPYPFPELNPISPNASVFRRGCEKLGIRTVVTPLAILSSAYEGRSACTNRGFCNEGCMPGAKFSTLIQHIPKAIAAGADVRPDCRVTQIIMSKHGKAKGVVYVHNGLEFKQSAKIVILAASAVETPRLLLNSADANSPQGLANSSGWVGRAIMPHSSHDVYAKFEEEIRMYKGATVLATTQEFYDSDSSRGFARGYTLHAHGARPVGFAEGIAKSGGATNPIWGERLRNSMLDYNYYGRVTLVGEVLPNPENRVELTEEKDRFGLPLAKVSFSYGDNDLKLIHHAVDKMTSILRAAEGQVEFVVPDTAHLMGGCRMGSDPRTSVVDAFGRSHDIANLFVCDASTFVTSGGGNPTGTVMALALRTADHILESMSKNGL